MPTNITVLQYTPSEIIGIFNDIHAHQNTQAAKVLNEAKERSRYLEKQLEEALNKNKGCSTECLGMVAAIVTVASAACWVICLII